MGKNLAYGFFLPIAVLKYLTFKEHDFIKRDLQMLNRIRVNTILHSLETNLEFLISFMDRNLILLGEGSDSNNLLLTDLNLRKITLKIKKNRGQL